MFIARHGFSSEPFCWSLYTSKKVDTLEVSNGIYDEIKVDESLETTNSIIKEDWTIDTVLLADYKNTLEAGNIFGVNPEIPIQYLRFKRRKLGELNWQVMIDVPFYKDIEDYNMVDYYIENAVDYEYSVVPVTQSIEGNGTTEQVETKYFGMFLTGKDDSGNIVNYPLRFDLKTSDITLNEDKIYQKTLSSKYPAQLCGESKYYTGNVAVKLISPTTEDNFGKVDMKAEKVYREAFEEFIHSGRSMLIRNHSMYILGTIGEPKKNPVFDEEVGFGLYDYSLSFTETNNAKDMSILKDSNLTYDIKTS
jgi:hypothetical protein